MSKSEIPVLDEEFDQGESVKNEDD